MKLSCVNRMEQSASVEAEWKKVRCVSVYFANSRQHEQILVSSDTPEEEDPEDIAWSRFRAVCLGLLLLLFVKIKVVALCLLAAAFFFYFADRALHDSGHASATAQGRALGHPAPDQAAER